MLEILLLISVIFGYRTDLRNKTLYYISPVVGQILLYGALKFKVVFVPTKFRDLSPSILTFYSK